MARTVLAALTLTAVAALSVGVAQTASALPMPVPSPNPSKTIKYDCGTSRGATLVGALYDDRPGELRSDSPTERGNVQTLPNNVRFEIPLQFSRGQVVLWAGFNPGYFDKTTAVQCNAMP